MRNFKNNRYGGSQGGSGNRFGGRDSGRPSFRSRNSGEVVMHDAVCSECGNNCQVPFEPTGSKPVYCSSCFQNMGGRSNSRPPQHRNFDRPSSNNHDSHSQENNPQLNAIYLKLDQILEVLKQLQSGPITVSKVADSTTPKAKTKKAKAKKTSK